MDMAEFDFNIAEGEFSSKADGTSVTLVYGEDEYEVSGIISKKYARKEVDGRFTTDLPLFTVSVTIAESQIPSAIPSDDYRALIVVIGSESYGVRYVTGTGFLTLTLKPLDGNVTDGEEVGDGDNAQGSTQGGSSQENGSSDNPNQGDGNDGNGEVNPPEDDEEIG